MVSFTPARMGRNSCGTLASSARRAKWPCVTRADTRPTSSTTARMPPVTLLARSRPTAERIATRSPRPRIETHRTRASTASLLDRNCSLSAATWAISFLDWAVTLPPVSVSVMNSRRSFCSSGFEAQPRTDSSSAPASWCHWVRSVESFCHSVSARGECGRFDHAASDSATRSMEARKRLAASSRKGPVTPGLARTPALARTAVSACVSFCSSCRSGTTWCWYWSIVAPCARVLDQLTKNIPRTRARTSAKAERILVPVFRFIRIDRAGPEREGGRGSTSRPGSRAGRPKGHVIAARGSLGEAAARWWVEVGRARRRIRGEAP